MSQSIYESLGPKAIRLITFEKDSNPPAFSLRHCSLRQAFRNYICLSYCWGRTLSPHPILCNGKEMQVHANLYDALIQLARREVTQEYWIDAICINQSNSEEKSFQIQLMGQIFEQADAVYVWLGTTFVMDGIDSEFLRNLEACDLYCLEDGTETETQVLVSRGLPLLDSSFWETVASLFNLPWFKRLWIVQEITLARFSHVLLGHQIVSFELLYSIASILCLLKGTGQMPARMGASQAEPDRTFEVAFMLRAIEKLHIHILTPSPFSLGALTRLILKVLENQDVSDAADRVHGMLGMFKHKFVKNVATNARSTVAETYEAFAVASLQADTRLNLLHYLSPTPAVSGLPSWCPYLSCLLHQRNILACSDGLFPEMTTPFQSGVRDSVNLRKRLAQWLPPRMKIRSPHTTARYVPASKTLLVKGIIIDKIAHMVSDHPDWDFSSPGLAQIEHWEQECLTLSQTTLQPRDPVPMCYIETLIGGPILHPDPLESASQMNLRLGYTNARAALRRRNDRLLGMASGDFGYIYFNAMKWCCQYRRFFSTTGSRIGLCPPHSKRGDLVCILWGARSPFILRPVPNTENFQLLGDCYADGLMSGEAFKIKCKERLKNMTFPLI